MGDSARPAVRALGVVLLGLGLMGMGGFGGGGREPGTPARDYRATFVDADGNRMTANRVTMGGDLTIEGDVGRGRLRVPFDNVTRIDFQPSDRERDRVRAEVHLREGEAVALSVRSSATFYGQTPGGAYQIRARDLRAVEFVQQ